MSIDNNNSVKMNTNKEFMNSLKMKIDAVIPLDQRRDVPAHYIKAIQIYLITICSYLGLFFTDNYFILIPLCILLGLSLTGIGFNVFHEAVHGSFSKSKNINKYVSVVSCSLIGVSRMLWKHKHNFLHHQYPNIQNLDDDLETRGNLRLSPHQELLTKYKYQHLYAIFLYGMTTIEWVFIKDFVQYFSLKMNEFQEVPKFKTSEHIEFWFSKLCYFILFVVIPLQHFSFPQFAIGLFIVNYSMSLALVSIFQLAHVMEESLFPVANDPQYKSEPIDWVKLQLDTTVNFAARNKFVTWYAGGLNFQIEHHLLPKISHIHYPKIAPLLEETAKEFNFPYYKFDNYGGALKSHYNILKILGSHKEIPA